MQKYLHDMAGWNALSTEAQERIIGRTKLSDIELDDTVKPTSAHNALTTIKENGERVKSSATTCRSASPARASLAPTSSATPFAAGHRADAENMFVGRPPGNYDRLLDFSRAVTGTLFFVPSATFLEAVSDDDARWQRRPPQAAANLPPSSEPVRDGSLGIGSLKGDPSA